MTWWAPWNVNRLHVEFGFLLLENVLPRTICRTFSYVPEAYRGIATTHVNYHSRFGRKYVPFAVNGGVEGEVFFSIITIYILHMNRLLHYHNFFLFFQSENICGHPSEMPPTHFYLCNCTPLIEFSRRWWNVTTLLAPPIEPSRQRFSIIITKLCAGDDVFLYRTLYWYGCELHSLASHWRQTIW